MGFYENSEFAVAKYNDIRDLLRDIYVYGCFPKEILVEKQKISPRKYDKEKKRIKEFLPQGFFGDERVNGHAISKCRYNFDEDPENKLEWTYRNKSFTINEIVVFFFAYAILYKAPEHQMSRKDLSDEIYNKVNENIDDWNISQNAFIEIMNTLSEYGLICHKSEKNKVIYSLPKNYWEGFSEEELKDIYLFASFLSDSMPLKTPYYFLKDKLDLYISSMNMEPVDDKFKIACKNNHLFSVLDDEISYALLKAIYIKQPVLIKFNKEEKVVSKEVFPIKTVWNATYGRQYVFCSEVKTQDCKFVRLDEIISVDILTGDYSSERPDYKVMEDRINTCWCADYHDGTEEVIIDFKIGDEELYVLRRLKREIDIQSKQLTENQEGEYNYRLILNVAEPKEMIPWIRSFGERAKVVKLGNSKEYFTRTLQDMLKNYEE